MARLCDLRRTLNSTSTASFGLTASDRQVSICVEAKMWGSFGNAYIEENAVAAAVLRWNRKEVVDHVLATRSSAARCPGLSMLGFLDPRDEPNLELLDEHQTWVWERTQSKEFEDLVRCRRCGSRWVVYAQSADGVRSERPPANARCKSCSSSSRRRTDVKTRRRIVKLRREWLTVRQIGVE